MAIEKRKIENLKPGKKYALNVKVKNTDLNIVSDLSDTIIFTVPTDTTIPSALTNLELFAGLENVMFVFDYSQDLDVRKYEYELYKNSDMSDQDGPLTGFADANVFTVSVDNLQTEENGGGLARFWGRARTIDTTGNAGPWTSLVETDDRIPLIDNQYIGSLTASKITAGTIGAHTITLNSASSIIKSSTFNGTLQGNGSYSFPNGGGQGWLINGQGKAYFYDATIVGSIDIGGFDSGSFHVDIEGNMWLGAGVYGQAPFRVSKEGVLQINQIAFDDIVEGIIDFNERNNRNPTTPDTPTLANTITAGFFNIGSSYKIVSPGNTSFTAIGADNNDVGTVFTAAGAGAGTGTVSGETIDHDNNDDGSVDISFEWNYPITIVAATSIVSGSKYQIVSPGNTSFTAIGADNNDVGTVFTANNVVPTGTGTVSVYSLERDIDGFYVHIHSSSLVTAGSFVVGRSYRIISAGNTSFTAIGALNNYVGTVFTATGTGTETETGTVAEVYTMGTSPALESTYPLRFEERAAIYRGLASNKFYTFGVRAFRIVDTDIDSDGIIYGDFVQSTVVEENPYRPEDNIAFKGDIEGTINGEDIDLIIGYATAGNTTAGNFNTRNDRNSTTPTTPTLASTITSSNLNIGSTYKIVSFGTTTNWNTAAGTNGVTYQEGSVFEAKAVTSGDGTVSGETIDHDINDDGSVDISFEWNYTVSETPSAANNIDGFAIYYYTSPTLDISAVTPSSPSAGSVTYTTLAPHGFAIGNTVVISDLVPVEYNGTFTVTAVTSTPSNTFTVANSTTSTVTDAVGSVFGNTAYTIGASPSNELVYFLPREKRALILQAVPSNKFYTFGVKAYRIVDTNLELPSATVAVTSIASNATYKIVSLGDTNWNTAGVSGTAAIGTVFTAAQAGTGTGTVKLYTLATSGILYSAAVQSTVTEENPYQPSTTVAFKGDVTGTINQVDVVDITTTYNNFNNRNDRFSAIPASATNVAFVTSDKNLDGSVNLTLDWDYPNEELSFGSILIDSTYTISNLGTTTTGQWQGVGAGSIPDVGTVFTATQSGSGNTTGEVIKHTNSIDGFAIYLRTIDTTLFTNLVAGTQYVIMSLGTTTTAQWQAAGVSGTPAQNTVFTALSAGVAVASSTSLVIDMDSKVFTITSNSGIATGQRVRATGVNVANYMQGIVTVSGTTMTMAVDAIGGSGTFASWSIKSSGDVGRVITKADYDLQILKENLKDITNITAVYLTPEKSAHRFPPLSSEKVYRAAIKAYRTVDTDLGIDASDRIDGAIVNAASLIFNGNPLLGGPDGSIAIGNGKIFIGKGNYNNSDTGFYVDKDSLFSLGDKLSWNGTTLTVTGAINATSGIFTNTVTVGGATSGTLQVGSSPSTAINIVGTNSNASTFIRTGSTITATTGNGFYFGADGKVRIASSTNSLTFDGTSLTINGGGTFTGALSGGTISIGSDNNIFKADSNGIYLGDATFADAEFSVTPAGYLKSTSGKIGGWIIGSVTGTANGAQTDFPGSIYQWKTVAGVATLSLMSPDGFAWFSGGLVAPTISGFSTGVTTNGGALNTMILRNIKYGSGRPTGGAIGDIYLS